MSKKVKNYLDFVPIKNKNIKWIEDSFGIITLEITRNGLFDKIAQKTFKVPPKSSVISSLTILITCCPGVKDFNTS